MIEIIRDISERFRIDGILHESIAFGNGHIHDTYLAAFKKRDKERRYIIQRINDKVFKNPIQLMENIKNITEYMKQNHRSDSDYSVNTLTLIDSHDDKPFVIDEAGGFWRAFRFIENTKSLELIKTTEEAFEAGLAFGQFQKSLLHYNGPDLNEVIPDFHDTLNYFNEFINIRDEDRYDRAKYAEREINYIFENKPFCRLFTESIDNNYLPLRIVHNDTKVNNLLFNKYTNKAECVIDLDTVMPGLVHYDLGDLIRTCTSPSDEDERDLSKVYMRMDVFKSLVKGYMGAAGPFITEQEKELLHLSGIVITLESGIRFLSDFLSDDRYFKAEYEEHNLDRCRTQLALVESMKINLEEMKEYIRKFF